MAKIFEVSILLMLVILNEAATPLFLQAITSALGTIPFTGGPMSTGLVGAKLSIGTKLLYYLGYFGRRSKNKSVPKKAETSQSSWRGASSGLQPLPLPYMAFGGGFPISAYQSSSFSSSGIDPNQLLQALIAQGVDANVAMNALNYAGGMGSKTKFPPHGVIAGFGMNTDYNAGLNPAFASNSIPAQGFSSQFSEVSNVQKTSSANEGIGEEVESFFTFLQDMDENTCISRLICEIGNDPSFLGDFSQNIHSMVGSLSVRPSSQAYPYMEIMQNGAKIGQCQEKFPECSDSSYEVVKSVAPSVDIPTGTKI